MIETELELPTPNLPLLRKVFEHIDAHPEEWCQSYYAIDMDKTTAPLYSSAPVPTCGTAFCVAGHAVLMTGHDIHWITAAGSYQNEIVSAMETTDGEDIAQVARRELGIMAHEADNLFAPNNSRSTLQQIGERIAERAGEVL